MRQSDERSPEPIPYIIYMEATISSGSYQQMVGRGVRKEKFNWGKFWFNFIILWLGFAASSMLLYIQLMR